MNRFRVLNDRQEITPTWKEFKYYVLHVSTGTICEGRMECLTELDGYKALDNFNRQNNLMKEQHWIYWRKHD